MPRKPKNQEDETPLTKRERQIMDVVYRKREVTAREILEELLDPPSYSTVRTLLTLLVRKGHLRCITKEKAHVYLAAKKKSAAAESALRRLVRTFFEGSLANAVSGLLSLEDHKLGPEEIQRLEGLIADARKEESHE